MHSKRASGVICCIAAAAWVSGCAELFDEFSTWPEIESVADSSVAARKDGESAGRVSSTVASSPTTITPAKTEIYKGTGRFVK